MPEGEPPISSFSGLLFALECEDVATLNSMVNSRMDGNGFVETEWDSDGVEVTIGFGTRALIAEFKFPIRLGEFWEVVNDYADEVEEFDDDE